MPLPNFNSSSIGLGKFNAAPLYVQSGASDTWIPASTSTFAGSSTSISGGSFSITGTNQVAVTGVSAGVNFPINNLNQVGVTGGIAITGNPSVTVSNFPATFNSQITGFPFVQLIGSGISPSNPVLTPVSITNDGEIMTSDTAQETNVYAAFSKQAVTGTAYGMLVDKSATGTWPHAGGTGRVDVSYLSLQVDKTATTTGSFSVGVITQLYPTSGVILFFGGLSFGLTSDSYLSRQENFSPSQIKCGVNSTGKTPWMLGTPSVIGSGFGSAIALDSVLGTGTVLPGTGDLVFRFNQVSGMCNGSARVLYHSHPFAPN